MTTAKFKLDRVYKLTHRLPEESSGVIRPCKAFKTLKFKGLCDSLVQFAFKNKLLKVILKINRFCSPLVKVLYKVQLSELIMILKLKINWITGKLDLHFDTMRMKRRRTR